MTGEQLRMAMSMLRITIAELAERSGVSRGTIIRMTNDLPVMHSSRAVVKSFLQSEDVVFVSETSTLSETVARRR
jgi:transcriptional regulator with XRE-family HTH domain